MYGSDVCIAGAAILRRVWLVHLAQQQLGSVTDP